MSISLIKPLIKHLERDESDLTKDIKHCIFHYLEEKYNSPVTAKLLDVCTFLDPRFKLDYVQECDRIDVKTLSLIHI